MPLLQSPGEWARLLALTCSRIFTPVEKQRERRWERSFSRVSILSLTSSSGMQLWLTTMGFYTDNPMCRA